MNVVDAAYATVHDYPGGSESLAPRLGMSPAVLRAKVNPNTDRNHLTLAEASAMIGITDDPRILQALASEHACIVQSCAVSPNSANQPITSLLLDVNEACGKFIATVRAALADGLVSENEMRRIDCDGLAAQRAVMSLQARLSAVTGQRLPATERA